MQRVLIVDDEAAYRRSLSALFARAGFEVVAVAGGVDAIRAANESSFDVAVTDWMLRHEVHGLDVARALHRDHPTLPIILFTGYPHALFGNDDAKSEFCARIEKPAEFSVILEAVRRAVAPAAA